MIDSTLSGAVVDERSAWSSELVVEADSGGEREQALQDSLAEPGERPRSVALERERALAAPEDRLDALTDRREVWALAGLVLATGSEDRGIELGDGLGERPPCVALVADQRLASGSASAGQELEGDLALIAFGGGDRHGSGCAVGGEDPVQAKAPEETGMAFSVAVVGGVCQGRALDRLAASGALHGRGVHEQQIVIEPGTLAGENLHQPLQRVRKSPSALEVAGLAGDRREQVAQLLSGNGQEPAVRGDAHDRLGNAQRDDLRVCDASPGVLRLLGQEIVSRHINGSEQQVEVGVHRGPLRSAMLVSTADFDPAAQKPSISTRPAVESII